MQKGTVWYNEKIIKQKEKNCPKKGFFPFSYGIFVREM